MCLENFSSQVAERHNKPEVETRYTKQLLDWIIERTGRKQKAPPAMIWLLSYFLAKL